MRIAQCCNVIPGTEPRFQSRLQVTKHDIEDMTAAGRELVARGEVAAENGRQCVAVREVKEAERRDADVELNWIDALAEGARRCAALEQRRDHADQRRMQL